MNPSDHQFWTTLAAIVIAVCFVVMALALTFAAVMVRRISTAASRLENRLEPVISKLNGFTAQSKEISAGFSEVSANLSSASRNLAESTDLIRQEIGDLRVIVNSTALAARDRVELVGQTIDRTKLQVADTADFVQARIVEPAREIAAIMAGVRKGLEVLFAPAPKQIDRVYVDDELFIG